MICYLPAIWMMITIELFLVWFVLDLADFVHNNFKNTLRKLLIWAHFFGPALFIGYTDTVFLGSNMCGPEFTWNHNRKLLVYSISNWLKYVGNAQKILLRLFCGNNLDNIKHWHLAFKSRFIVYLPFCSWQIL